MIFSTPYKKNYTNNGVVLSNKRLVETAGYRTTKQMVLEFIQAGKILTSAREMAYTYPGEFANDNQFPDPTMSPNYDLADFSQHARQLREKSDAVKAARKEAAKNAQQKTSEKIDPASPEVKN